MALADVRVIGIAIFFSIVENLNSAASQTIQAQFALSATEAITIAETEGITAQFNPSIVEAFSILDSLFVRGWFRIDDSEDANWGYRVQTITQAGTFAGFTFGGLPFAGYLSFSGSIPDPIVPDTTPNWTQIDDTQSNTWILIDDSQG